jgi:hypothetical protein
LFCAKCGTPLADNAKFCPSCGTPTEIPVAPETVEIPEVAEPVEIAETFEAAETVETTEIPEAAEAPIPVIPVQPVYSPIPPEKPVKTGISKPLKIIIPVAAALIVIILCATLLVSAAGGGLAKSVKSVGDDFSERFNSTPLSVLTSLYNSLNDGAIDVDFEYNNPNRIEIYTGSVTLKSNAKERKFEVSGDASLNSVDLDASLYLDGKIAALGSSLLDGDKYGVTYATFDSDIEGFAELIGLDPDGYEVELLKSYVDVVESSLGSGGDADAKAFQKDAQKVFKTFLDGLSAKKGSEKITLGGKSVSAKTVTYTIAPKDIKGLLTSLIALYRNNTYLRSSFDVGLSVMASGIDYDEALDELEDALEDFEDYYDGDIKITFFTAKKRLTRVDVAAELEIDRQDVEIEATLNFGAAADDDWTLKFKLSDRYSEYSGSVRWTYSESDGTAKNTIKVSFNDDGYEEAVTLSSTWNKKDGAFKLTAKGDYFDEQLKGNLIVNKSGFTLDISPEMYPAYITLNLKFTGTKGAKIAAPSFINLDKWDEDLIYKIEDAFEELYYL